MNEQEEYENQLAMLGIEIHSTLELSEIVDVEQKEVGTLTKDMYIEHLEHMLKECLATVKGL